MPLQVCAHRPHCWSPNGNRPSLDNRSFRRVPPLRQRTILIARLGVFVPFDPDDDRKVGQPMWAFHRAILLVALGQSMPSRYQPAARRSIRLRSQSTRYAPQSKPSRLYNAAAKACGGPATSWRACPRRRKKKAPPQRGEVDALSSVITMPPAGCSAQARRAASPAASRPAKKKATR